MNRIEELIEQLCPEGVEFRDMEEVFELRNGYTPSKANPEFWENGKIPWFRMEDIRNNGRILSDSIQHITPEAIKTGNLFSAYSLIVSTSATIGEHALITVDFLSNQRFTCLTRKQKFIERIDMYFFQYYMFVIDEWCKINVNISGFAGVDMPKFKKLQIPIPPLSIQREIVIILDKFTQLEAELEAELEARRKQYEYYRSKLLTFNMWGGVKHYKSISCVRCVTLGEIGAFFRGNGLQKKDFTDSGIGCIHYGQIYTYYGTFAEKTKSFVSKEFAMKFRKAKKGDLIIASTSENVEDVCKAVAWLGDEDIAVSNDAYIFRHNQNAKFIAYFFKTPMFFDQMKKYVTGTKVIRVSGENMARISIPIPPLTEQERIVGILDKFDKLVNDISEGLPAEIAARRKQYEYYRGKLLSFKQILR